MALPSALPSPAVAAVSNAARRKPSGWSTRNFPIRSSASIPGGSRSDPPRLEQLTWPHQLLLGIDQEHLTRTRLGRPIEHAEDRRGGTRHRLGGGAGTQVVGQKQGRDRVA